MNSFGGLPFDGGYLKKKQGGRLDKLCALACLMQVLGGAAIITLCSLFLFSFAQVTGIAIGVLLCVVGVVGLFGSVRRHRDLLSFHVVGAIVALMLSFQFVGQVVREVDIDCSLAELFIKGNVLEEITRNMARHDMFDTIYKRLNEVENSLSVVQEGVSSTAQVVKENILGSGYMSEGQWISEKLETLKKHAEDMYDEIRAHPELTPDKLRNWTQEDLEKVKKKVRTLEGVLNRFEKYKSGTTDSGITAAEYESLLKAVTEAFSTPTVPNTKEDKDYSVLSQQHADLQKTKSAYESLKNQLVVLDKFRGEDFAAEKLKEQQKIANINYMSNLEKQKISTQKDMHMHLLRHMPEHCVKEGRGVQYMEYVGIITAVFQFVSIYVTLCLIFRIPNKIE